MAYIPHEFVSHARKVKAFFKLAMRDAEESNRARYDQRVNRVLIRHQFDLNKNIKDPIQARAILEVAQEKFRLERSPFEKFYFPDSPGGTAYQRNSESPDWILDYWHPLEKAQYPKYFALREKRKKEFMEWYDKTYGKPKQVEDM